MQNFGYVFIFLLLISCKSTSTFKKENTQFISFSNADVAYSGRIDSSKSAATLVWPGNSVKLNFEGTSIAVLMEDDSTENYFNVILDRDSISLLRLDSTKQFYTLASNLPKGKHSIEIYKRSEWRHGTSRFYGFQVEGNAKILPKDKPKKRKIEIYGNSISVGYAVEDTSGKDSPDSTFTNNYNSYGAIMARHFDAEYRCICKSGIGIMLSWFPIIMPELYDRTNAEVKGSSWDFSKYTPDVVVVNLFQNDSWLTNRPKFSQFKNRFGTEKPSEEFIIQAYQDFVSKIRAVYPDAHIVCALGNMDATREGSPWMAYIQKATDSLNDSKIYTHFVPYKNTPGHPTIAEQKTIAQSLIRFIEKEITW